MTISIKQAVFNKPTFEKIADYELPKNISEWNEEILKQFYEDVDFLPKEIGSDISMKDVDENKGYGKGSVVVFYDGKKINFPIIIKNFKLSPFDTFAYDNKGEIEYQNATLENIKRVLSSEKIGTLENYWGKGGKASWVKSPGGVQPKEAIDIQDAANIYPPFSKMSGWPFLAKKEDLEKLAVQLEAEPDVGASFVENTGDLIGNIIELKDNENRVIGDDHKEGILDLNDVVMAKQIVTAIDSQMLDSNSLIPIEPPSVCELRMYQYPSMEDFLESGSDMAGRFMASKVGKPVLGIVLDVRDLDGSDCPQPMTGTSEDEKKKAVRNKRDQIFLSVCGCYYSEFHDYDKHGIGFYGTKVLTNSGAVEKAIGLLSKNTSDDFINTNKENRRDGSDKLFKAIGESEQGKKEDSFEYANPSWNSRLLILFGAGDAWECSKLSGNFKKYRVNDTNVYVSKNDAVIPANVATMQKVKSVKDPVYKMIIGKVENIYLIPEGSLVINGEYIKLINRDDFIRPDKTIQSQFENASINKVAVCVSSGKSNEIGYKIEGKPMEPLKKIAGINGNILSTKSALSALKIMGMTKEASEEVLKVAVNRYADSNCQNKNVMVYGVRDDYINESVFAEREKIARVKKLLKKFAYDIRKDLVKEAGVLDDPEAVDVVLSLNFINEDSLAGYVENINEMKKVNSSLSKMLIASRMGLSDLDESAIKKSIQGLSAVIEDLEGLKMAISEK
jgi:hypothetical protein